MIKNDEKIVKEKIEDIQKSLFAFDSETQKNLKNSIW